MIPYARQLISTTDIEAVIDVLKSDWLTTGPQIEKFENSLSAFTGANYAVSFSSGTAALHAAMAILDISSGDEVIVSPISFVASANSIIYQGATPVFADVNANTLLLDPAQVRSKITPRTKAVLAVDYAGQPCDYVELKKICIEYKLTLIADACHSLGAKDNGIPVGRLADLTILSFHPVKHICTGEGGALLLHNEYLAERARKFRNHGIDNDHQKRKLMGTWDYDMDSLGFNYRLTDIQCALGISQLNQLPAWLQRRNDIAHTYDSAFAELEGVNTLGKRSGIKHSYHLYVIRIDKKRTGISRNQLYAKLRKRGIGVNVHYKPIFNHSYYRMRYPEAKKNCSIANRVADEILSIPIYANISQMQVNTVVRELHTIIQNNEKYGSVYC